MSEQLPLGKLVTDEKYYAGYRDAVHVAVVPLTAAEILIPGQRVGNQGNAHGSPVVGIVDPFLDRPVPAGARFWCFLMPGTIRSLRHHWQHDGFGEPAPPTAPAPPDASMVLTARRELEGKADELSLTYDRLMAVLDDYHAGRITYYVVDESISYQTDEEMERLWTWWGIVRGTHHDPNDRSNFFSCSC